MIEKAKAFATKAHQGQKRKNSDVDYIVHPVRVAHTLEAAGCDAVVICAGYLHDVVEDTAYELEDIEREFNQEVRDLVAAHSEDKSKSWQERKQHTIDTIRTGNLEVKSLIVADKLDNLLSLEKDFERDGDALWKQFNAGFEHQSWYNQAIAANMTSGVARNCIPDFFYTYQNAVDRFFRN
ncbi:HD domain-containing protein [Halobacillus amylolyticus]|uniref:HD domain-containing protein n=1 Tax=Halobacillus amylolyticus TaxID=2932259 RepID=A0ABY4H6M9_9BACI|nr:HD domain-containing protein [Halobacillus amylolyticus]UOR10523.1 HD domain-containing protein [Halobacillus amylolyticus]